MKKTECFKIQILKSNNNTLDIENATPLLRILHSRNWLSLNPTIIEADPFLFVKGDTLYLFYESKKIFSSGIIKMTKTKDLYNWSKPVIVLDEPFHLSFPFVFEDNGDIYMIPETGEDKSVRLYKAENSDLSRFIFVRSLLNRKESENVTIDYADSCILIKNNKYYLFTTVQYEGINHLELYISDNLYSTFSNHTKSAICTSNRYGRNAGSIIQFNNSFYRVSQDCVKRYGDNVSLHRIVTLTENEYKEELYMENIYNQTIQNKFYKNGGHQFNIAKFKGNIIIATDAKEYRLFILSKIFNKIKRLVCDMFILRIKDSKRAGM